MFFNVKKTAGLLIVLMLVLSIMACNVLVSKKVVTVSSPVEENVGRVDISSKFLVVTGDTSKSAGSISVTALPDDIVKVTVTITGDNIDDPIVYDLVKLNGEWTGIIGNIPAGEAEVTAQAFDDTDAVVYESVADITVVNHQTLSLNLTLLPTDPPDDYDVRAPRIIAVNISPQQVAPEDTVNLEVVAQDFLYHDASTDTDVYGDENLTYVWNPQDIGSFSDRTSKNPVWTAPSTPGAYQLTITVIDQEFLIDHFTITIEVDEKYGSGNLGVDLGTNNYPEIFSLLADPTRIDKGESTQLQVNAMDSDGDTLTYSWASSLAGTFDDPTIPNPVFTVDPGVEYGICTITVEVSDGGLVSRGSIVINVSDDPNVNAAPVIKSAFQATVSIAPSGEVFLSVKAQDPEGEVLTFNWSATGGVLGTQTDSFTSPNYDSSIIWTAPTAAVVDPINITVEIVDERGLARLYNFAPIVVQ